MTKLKRARSYKSKWCEARVDTDLNSKNKVVFLPEVSLCVSTGDAPPTEAQFRVELVRLNKWVDQTLVWLDQYKS